MFERVRRSLSFANVISVAALFVALGGSAYAVTQIDRNSVKSKHIVNGQVTASDLAGPEAPLSAGLPGNDTDCTGDAPGWYEDATPGFESPVGYERDLEGRVYLSGIVRGCGGLPTLIFTLPPGFRPAESVVVKFGNERIGVMPNGDVLAYDGGNPLSLQGVSFRCAPSGENGCP